MEELSEGILGLENFLANLPKTREGLRNYIRSKMESEENRERYANIISDPELYESFVEEVLENHRKFLAQKWDEVSEEIAVLKKLRTEGAISNGVVCRLEKLREDYKIFNFPKIVFN